jgi:excisionase family DNA binding protein
MAAVRQAQLDLCAKENAMLLRREEREKVIDAFTTIAEFLAKAAIEHVELSARKFDPIPAAKPVEPLVYTRKQAAEVLGISVATLRRLVAAGEITPIMLTGKAPKYDRTEIELMVRRKHGQFPRV